MLLRDNLDNILMEYAMNITDKGEDILKKLANEERMISYKNLFSKTDNRTKTFHFLKRFGTLYYLLIDLLND